MTYLASAVIVQLHVSELVRHEHSARLGIRPDKVHTEMKGMNVNAVYIASAHNFCHYRCRITSREVGKS